MAVLLTVWGTGEYAVTLRALEPWVSWSLVVLDAPDVLNAAVNRSIVGAFTAR